MAQFREFFLHRIFFLGLEERTVTTKEGGLPRHSRWSKIFEKNP